MELIPETGSMRDMNGKEILVGVIYELVKRVG
jgi:hypothetical protein